MEIIHVSAECYPAAKVGGLADVVGALPIYQQSAGHTVKVIIPKYRTYYLQHQDSESVHQERFALGNQWFECSVLREKKNKPAFELYTLDIPGLFDREGIYGYEDDPDRFIAFQVAVLLWISKWAHHPDIIHVHDHHAALIPFMCKHSFTFARLQNIPALLTIHNAQYQGWMSWDKAAFLPAWDTWRWGLLEWNHVVNPLACGIKCADKVTTVSNGYLEELTGNANGIEWLIAAERSKCMGLLNGIDTVEWNPATDTRILSNYSLSNVKEGKALNKKMLCKDFGFDPGLPLFVFIGRFVTDKGADLLAPSCLKALDIFGERMNFLILGSGDSGIANMLQQVNRPEHIQLGIGYNEKLSRLMYAGADFLLMPSRVEPCGLNQMYAMRYGTVPVVSSTGGLKDTVTDFEDPKGNGITFEQASVEDIVTVIGRALHLYQDGGRMDALVRHIMTVDNSWESRSGRYLEVYAKLCH